MPEVGHACKHSPKRRQRAKGCTGERRYVDRIDNNRAIWSGFGNHYWPALYFIDKSGRVRDHPLTGSGIALGFCVAVFIMRVLQGMLFGVTPLDPATFITAGFPFLSVFTVLASLVPARRAMAVNPLVALRTD